MLTFGSLFTGIGGFDIGFEEAGMCCFWQVEIDDACNRILRRHWPNVRRYRDAKEVGGHNLEPVDLVCGGFPCQDLSVAGKRVGLAGKRSGLFFEFMRIIGELSPRWVVIENVPGLLSSNRGRDMGTILGALAQFGYGYAYRVLDAQYFGVAQRRRRVFIVGHLGKPWSAPAKVLFEPESCEWDSPPSRKKKAVSATLLASGAGTSRTAGIASEIDFLVAHSLTTRPGQRQEPTSDTFVIQDMDSSEDGTVWGTPLITAPTLRGFGHGWQGQHNDDVAKCGIIRRLTPLECERLQGFKDGWTAGESDTTRYKMLGNAVCVNVVKWVGERIIKYGDHNAEAN